ncbi:unnamed protein product [Ectocarpus sp. CCAP 1310/34]|nr:unnamed protein product [Ectocarpus sp. CCAP 1310/34]
MQPSSVKGKSNAPTAGDLLIASITDHKIWYVVGTDKPNMRATSQKLAPARILNATATRTSTAVAPLIGDRSAVGFRSDAQIMFEG